MTDDTSPVETVLGETASRFSRDVADRARRGRQGYEYRYGLWRVEDGVSAGQPSVKVYTRGDSCIITGDEFEHSAFDINQFEVHDLVRDVIDRTDYILSYVDWEWLPDHGAEALGLETEAEDE